MVALTMPSRAKKGSLMQKWQLKMQIKYNQNLRSRRQFNDSDQKDYSYRKALKSNRLVLKKKILTLSAKTVSFRTAVFKEALKSHSNWT